MSKQEKDFFKVNEHQSDEDVDEEGDEEEYFEEGDDEEEEEEEDDFWNEKEEASDSEDGGENDGTTKKRKRSNNEDLDDYVNTKKRKKEEGPKKQGQITIDNTREYDDTVVFPDDSETLADEEADEFASYFKSDTPPKILLTTSLKKYVTLPFLDDLMTVFPNMEYYDRKNYRIKTIVEYAKKRDFSDVIFVNEARKKIHSLTLIHLPNGPTAFFKLSGVKLIKDIKGHGKATSHFPEVVLNNFNTRLGHTIGRMFASLFPQVPNFRGRRVATFHNQRDFIFFRHHRYVFEKTGKNAFLQELGPQFCLKLQWLQKGTFNPTEGEFEWLRKVELETSRRRFFL